MRELILPRWIFTELLKSMRTTQTHKLMSTMSMNHCVPEWDAATSKEMDGIWEPTDFFSVSKGKWDSGHTRKLDCGFVPELDFEELCWEDGQLLVVMQGLNGRGNVKNRSASQLNSEEAILTSALPVTGAGTAELADSSSAHIYTQEDELLSWLQHPSDDLIDRLQMPSDVATPSTCLADGERVHSSDLTHQGLQPNVGSLEDIDNGPASRFSRTDTFAGHGSVDQQTGFSAGACFVPDATLPNQELPLSYPPLTAGVEISQPPQMHSSSASVPYGASVTNTTTSAMNFSNFSRPAVAFKANLHSLGIANGLSGAERLKQLDRMAVDMNKLDSIDLTRKRPKLIAPRREVAALPAITGFSPSVGASFIQDPGQNFSVDRERKHNACAVRVERTSESNASLQKEVYQDVSATRASNKGSGMGIESDGWNSSFMSSATLGMDKSTRILEVPEPSELSSSGGSEDSDDVDGKRAVGLGKRKICDEDSEIQSKAFENEATGSKKQFTTDVNTMKRSKAAENHNQSERRRRDRISEKMKTLQALVPNSYKTDKASMLEEAIAYIKALKSQIHMMSYRGGMLFSPMLVPHGVQHMQMASWPRMNMGVGMNMGMGTSAGMGIFDMNMVMATAAPRPFLPMMSFPTAVYPAVQTAAFTGLDTAHMTDGTTGHVVPLPAHQIVVPLEQGVAIAGMSNSSPVGTPPQSSTFQQGQLKQGTSYQMAPIGNNVSDSQRCLQPTTFMSGYG